MPAALRKRRNAWPVPGSRDGKMGAESAKLRNPATPKKPGGGRIAKPHVRHNLTIRADLSERLVNTAEKDGLTVTAVVEGLIELSL